jgi:hypothetical protein
VSNVKCGGGSGRELLFEFLKNKIYFANDVDSGWKEPTVGDTARQMLSDSRQKLTTQPKRLLQ